MSDNTDDEEDVAEPIFPESGPGREEMVADYLPESDDWPAKTHLDATDPAALAALSNMGEMFPEVDDLQPLIDDALVMFMKSKTSVKGMSRDEYKSIMQSMYGKSSDGDGQSTAMKLVAADED